MASVLVIATRLAAGPFLWLAALLVLAATILGVLEVLGAEQDPGHPGIPIESLILPGAAAVATAGAAQLVPVGILLVPAWAAAAGLIWATIEIERRVLERTEGPTPDDRALLLSGLLLVAFLGFTGVAAAIPGAFVDPGSVVSVDAGANPGFGGLFLLAVGDALVAGLLGYRLAALRAPNFNEALAAAVTYAVLIAISAALLRLLELPRLLGPALLVLVLYLWSQFRGGPRGTRRDPYWALEVLALAAVGAIVITWAVLAR